MPRVEPRLHLGEIETTTILDLGCPLTALAVSRVLHLLEPSISAISKAVKIVAPEIALETQSSSPFSWRLDTHAVNEDFVSDGKESFENIIGWMEGQDHLFNDPKNDSQKDDSRVTPSDISTPRTQTVTGSQISSSTSPSSVHESPQVPDLQEPQPGAQEANTTEIPTFISRKSCSVFAQKNAINDFNMYCWMFNRQAIPRSLASDRTFFDEYKEITGFIWPEEWKTRDDLPIVDLALKPFIEELFRSVTKLKSDRRHAITCIKRENTAYLQILERNVFIVFHTSQGAHVNVKRTKNVNVNEATWRHDHDALLRYLFKQLTYTPNPDERDLAVDTSLETTLRFAKRDILESEPSDDMIKNMEQLTSRLQRLELEKWISERGGRGSEATDENKHQMYVSSQFDDWLDERRKATEKILQLGEDPSTGTCDAFGHLLVMVPGALYNDLLHHFQLVRHGDKSGQKYSGHAVTATTQEKASGNSSQLKHGSHPTETTRNLSVPSKPASKQSQHRSEHKARRYNIPSASLSSTIASQSPDGADKLDTELQDMKIGDDQDFEFLELPIVIVEHKRQSERPGKATNQMRMYLISAVKFLETLGISGVPIYGIQTDGRYAFFPAAVIKNDGFVHLFERQVEKVDLSTPLGAWHYATVVARLADKHSTRLKNAFDKVKDNLHKHEAKLAAWTIDHQRVALIAEGKALEHPKKPSEKK
ncbi:hypothetical protein AX17_004981 [Amanita inopinata Kibby_2008]|nr:hypothetical protein AX17_004981 [Amanita inopinata Kibby_2008]